jgi:hypothetical protein
MKDKRTNPRLLCAELVELIYRDNAGYQRRKIVNLEDISQSGMCLQVEARVPEGAHVCVRHSKGQFTGVVRYSEFRDTSYFLGIEFEPESAWSEDRFRPEHLVDPRELVCDTV